VKAVADRYVDQPVFAANRDSRLGTELREREEAFPLTTSEDDREHFAVDGHVPFDLIAPASSAPA